MKTLFITLLTILFSIQVFALHNDVENLVAKPTISGVVKDKQTGEDLVGATIYIQELSTGTVTNIYGFYSISIAAGNYTLDISFVGYEKITKKLTLETNTTINVELNSLERTLATVEIKGRNVDENITSTEMSTVKMDIKTIRQIPAFMGEVDIIKAIQLLPGVQAASEGSSGFSVRGGNPDQNLILLDEAVVYNASHLMGFFSVFNNDAIKDVKLYKGDIPASQGGRLSSLVDIRMKEGNLKKFSGTGGIGTISSRLTFEGPLQKDRTSFIVSGRRTYADIFLALSSNEEMRDNTLYFYDLNTKLNHKINDDNRLFISSYYGKDVFKNNDFNMGWGNTTFSLRWNHLFSKQLFSNFTFTYSNYDYHLGVPEGEANSFIWQSLLRDFAIKGDFTYYLNPENTLKFGVHTLYHRINPGSAKGIGDETFFNEYQVPTSNSLEHALYASNEQKVGALLTLKYGIRYSLFRNVGTSTIFNFDENFEKIDSTLYKRGDIFNSYSGLEPRIGANYVINERTSLKGSYSRTIQYIHLASNSTAGSPLDVWFPSSPNVKPQESDQVALGIFKNFRNNLIETSVEAYYKKINNAIDFKDHAYLLLNKELEGELRFGEAEAFGLEFLVRLLNKKMNGWVSYTLSRSERTFPDINDGNTYVSPYDKTHDVTIVLNYNLSKRLAFGATWVYITGSPVTFPTGRFEYGNLINPVYSDRNAYRMPDYHRLDLSITLKGKEKPNKKWFSEWNLSVYNAYNRKNAWVINFEQEEFDPSITYAEMTYLFSIIPAITYNFHF